MWTMLHMHLSQRWTSWDLILKAHKGVQLLLLLFLLLPFSTFSSSSSFSSITSVLSSSLSFSSFHILLLHLPPLLPSSSFSLFFPLFLLTQISQMLYALHSETGLWKGLDEKKLRPLVNGHSHMSNLEKDPTAVTQASEVCTPS